MTNRTCKEKGCGKPHAARGWCKRHYYLWYNHRGATETPLQLRQVFAEGDATHFCTKCQKRQSIEMFSFSKNKSGNLRPISRCRTCASEDRREYNGKNRERARERAREGRARRDAATVLRYEIRRSASTIGLDPDDVEAYFATHDGLCEVCGKPPVDKRLAIDHDHKTGAFRGLLCRKCNGAIGLFNDDPELLRAALQYFERDATGSVRTRIESGKPKRNHKLHPVPRSPDVYSGAPCQDCGTMFEPKGGRKRCADCARSHRRRRDEQNRPSAVLALF